MPYPLERPVDGDWEKVRDNTDQTAQRLNPVFPQARVYKSGAQSLTNNTVTALWFESERWDNGDLHMVALSTATTANTSPNLTLVTPTTMWQNGMNVVGTGIPTGTAINSGAGTATMVMSANATASAAGVTITGYGTRLTASITGLWAIGGWVTFANKPDTTERQVFVRLNGATDLVSQNQDATNADVCRMNIGDTQYQLAAGDYVELTAYQLSGGALNVTAAEFWMSRLGGYTNQGVG